MTQSYSDFSAFLTFWSFFSFSVWLLGLWNDLEKLKFACFMLIADVVMAGGYSQLHSRQEVYIEVIPVIVVLGLSTWAILMSLKLQMYEERVK